MVPTFEISLVQRHAGVWARKGGCDGRPIGMHDNRRQVNFTYSTVQRCATLQDWPDSSSVMALLALIPLFHLTGLTS
jgi:hypothetical protein